MKGLCSECRFLMQAENSMCCGHKNANMNTQGNGHYVYPPAKWQCDIDLFEQTDTGVLWTTTMANTAKEHGWEQVKIDTLSNITTYKRL